MDMIFEGWLTLTNSYRIPPTLRPRPDHQHRVPDPSG
jgi:hypothetical protein